MCRVVILIALVTFASSIKIPSNFQKCSKTQADFKGCVLKAAQHGISQLTKPYKEVNLPNLDPYEVKEMTIAQGTGPVAVEQKFTDCKVFGMSKTKLEKLEFDFDRKVLEFIGTVPELRKLCTYQMTGKVLLLPVNGTGKSTIILKNLKVNQKLNFQETNRRDKSYLKFSGGGISMDPEFVSYNFDSSINKQISDRLNSVLNENWKAVFDDVKSSYGQLIEGILLSLFNGFFSKVSVEEAFE